MNASSNNRKDIHAYVSYIHAYVSYIHAYVSYIHAYVSSLIKKIILTSSKRQLHPCSLIKKLILTSSNVSNIQRYVPRYNERL